LLWLARSYHLGGELNGKRKSESADQGGTRKRVKRQAATGDQQQQRMGKIYVSVPKSGRIQKKGKESEKERVLSRILFLHSEKWLRAPQKKNLPSTSGFAGAEDARTLGRKS